MQSKYLFIFLGLIFLASSCKKCFTCEIYSHCATCTAYDSDGTMLATTNEVCGTEEEIEDMEQAIQGSWGSIDGVTTQCDKSKELDGYKEVCAKKSDAEDRVLILELAGYTCIED